MRDNRYYRPCDQVPVFSKSKRPDWLDVENVLGLFLGPKIEIGIVLKRQAYQAGNRVLDCLGQFFRSVLAGLNDAVAICRTPVFFMMITSLYGFLKAFYDFSYN